ncbi:MAG: GGDEF domain-containing protein [Deefgea sp.]
MTTLLWATVITGVLAIAQYILLARSHHSERGLGTIACGGGLLAAGGVTFVLLLNTDFSSAAALVWISGLLVLLAGTRRFFVRPALLGWWAAALGISGFIFILQCLGFITTQTSLHLMCLITVPLWLVIAYEARLAHNDEQWALPRSLLITILLIFALTFLALGLYLVPQDNFQATLLITLLLSQLILPYAYHNALSHRLHTRLIKLARYDALTGLLNRRGLEECAIKELRRAQKHQQSFAMICVNLKQFQEINQRYGFAAGDMALRQSARVLKDIAADTAVTIGRFTGNDFILLCSNMATQPMRNMMLEIELSINALQIDHSDSSFHPSCAVNVVRAGIDGDSVNELLNSLHIAIQKRKITATSSKQPVTQDNLGSIVTHLQSKQYMGISSQPKTEAS